MPRISQVAAAAAQVPAYYNPAWSPDSRTILFESNRDGRFAVYSVGVDGNGLRRLTDGAANDVQPRWSPDGKRIVFVSERDGHSQLYLMNADGSGQVRLKPLSSDKEFFPSFSPDGESITFGSQDERNRSMYYVWVARVDGTGARQLTDSSRSASGPRWSADGTRIIFESAPLLERGAAEAPRDFVRRRDALTVTMSIRPDGTGATVVAAEPSTAEDSPDGRWKVAVKAAGDGAGIYLIDKATGAERRLVGGP